MIIEKNVFAIFSPSLSLEKKKLALRAPNCDAHEATVWETVDFPLLVMLARM